MLLMMSANLHKQLRPAALALLQCLCGLCFNRVMFACMGEVGLCVSCQGLKCSVCPFRFICLVGRPLGLHRVIGASARLSGPDGLTVAAPIGLTPLLCVFWLVGRFSSDAVHGPVPFQVPGLATKVGWAGCVYGAVVG